MSTNLKIDDDLLEEALKLGGFRTKKDTVNQALRDFVAHQKQLNILRFEGQFDEFDDFDYKSFRKN